MSIKRQDIVNAVKARLQTISVANGYHTAVGSHVYLWRTSVIESANLPALIVRDVANAVQQEGVNTPLSIHTHSLFFEVDAIASQSTTTDTSIRQIVADVYKAIGVDDTFGGLTLACYLESDEIVLEDQKDKTIGSVMIKFSALYRTSKYQES